MCYEICMTTRHCPQIEHYSSDTDPKLNQELVYTHQIITSLSFGLVNIIALQEDFILDNNQKVIE